MGAGEGPDFHAPQHFLYFLPLPHGHGSFLPVFAIALLLGLREAARFSLESAAPWPARFTRFWLFSRKHAHHPISARGVLHEASMRILCKSCENPILAHS